MPAVLVTGAVEADGRDERSYDCTTGMTPRERAWEFLRRNPAFQREVTAASQQANSWSYQPLLDLVASAGDLLRWGVLFRRVLWAKFDRFWFRSGASMCCQSLQNICQHRRRQRRANSWHCHVVRRSCLAPGKGQHVLLRNAEHTLQLAVSGVDILSLSVSEPRRSGPRAFVAPPEGGSSASML